MLNEGEWYENQIIFEPIILKELFGKLEKFIHWAAFMKWVLCFQNS